MVIEMSVTSVRLSSDIEIPLAKLSKQLDRSKNYLINQAIKEFLSRQALAESRWQDTLVALDSVKNDQLVDESEVFSWLESWGTNQEKAPPKL